MAKYIVGVIFIILVTGAGYYFLKMQTPVKKPLNTVSYVCSESKTIKAIYYKDSVDLVLSDGRSFSLPQAISASGARYANADEAVVFWNKGQGAFITEGANPDNQTFKNCGEGAATASQANVFTNSSSTFSVQYPAGWTPNGDYKYTGVSAAKPIFGVQFKITGDMATGTNLSNDSYVSVEQLPRATSCTADIYLLQNVKAKAVDLNGHSYSVASTTEAAAGNRYEEYVFALPGSNPCTAVRYFVHYGAIGNYPTSTTKEFDRAALFAAFDTIRDAVTVIAPAAGTTPTPPPTAGTSTTRTQTPTSKPTPTPSPAPKPQPRR